MSATKRNEDSAMDTALTVLAVIAFIGIVGGIAGLVIVAVDVLLDGGGPPWDIR